MLHVSALRREGLFVGAHQRERAQLKPPRSYEEVEKQLLDGVDSAHLVTVHASEQNRAAARACSPGFVPCSESMRPFR
jgi:hypothetical protein